MSEKDSKTRRVTMVDLLQMFDAGSFMVSVNGLPILSVDAGSRFLELEAKGVRESGLKLAAIIRAEGQSKGVAGLLKGAESIAKGLSQTGWKMTLYDRGGKILSMGHGVSELTGRISVSPLKLRRILKTL